MTKTNKGARNILRTTALLASTASLLAVPLVTEVRLKPARQSLTDTWRSLPIEPRHSTQLGISFRTPQIEALRLDIRSTLETLLAYPFELIRLGAYWKRIESEPGAFHTDELDWQIEAAERAGKQIILCLGPLKTFSYPEFFTPEHHLPHPFPKRTRITPDAYPTLLATATAFITRLIERYKEHNSIIAWQLEHEAVDPLGMEHSWRLDTSFVEQELKAVREADPSRPILLNGFLPTSLLVSLSQWWQTRDQGDSLDVAQRLADIVGIDYYPRHALIALGERTVYLDGSKSRWWQQRRLGRLFSQTHTQRQKLMVSEGQAEPWEAVTAPPNPRGQGMASCLPEHIITNYNTCMRWSQQRGTLSAYLFWGAEYWILRQQCSDPSYLQAFARILEQA